MENLGAENLSRKERRELKRRAREEQLISEKKRLGAKRILKWVLILAVVAAVLYGGYYLLIGRERFSGPDLSQAIESLSRDHVSIGTEVKNYNSNPPTSGPHWPETTSRGIHDEEVADEYLVHNLEHGEIWLSYRPGIPAEIKKELENITKDFSKVVLTPRSKNDADIALAAWGRLDKFNLEGQVLDKARVENFIRRWRNKGPELVP